MWKRKESHQHIASVSLAESDRTHTHIVVRNHGWEETQSARHLQSSWCSSLQWTAPYELSSTAKHDGATARIFHQGKKQDALIRSQTILYTVNAFTESKAYKSGSNPAFLCLQIDGWGAHDCRQDENPDFSSAKLSQNTNKFRNSRGKP